MFKNFKKYPKGKKIRIIVITVLIIGLAGVLTYEIFKPDPLPEYELVKAEKGDIAQTFTATGTVESNNSSVYEILDGVEVLELKVKVGDKVKKGDLLATFDTSGLSPKLNELRSEYNDAYSKYSKAASSSSEASSDLKDTTNEISKLEKQISKLEKDIEKTQAKEKETLKLPEVDGNKVVNYEGNAYTDEQIESIRNQLLENGGTQEQVNQMIAALNEAEKKAEEELKNATASSDNGSTKSGETTTLPQSADEILKAAEQAAKDAAEKAQKAADEAKKAAEEAQKKGTEEAKKSAEEAQKAADTAKQKAGDANKKVEEARKNAQEEAKKAKDDAAKKITDSSKQISDATSAQAIENKLKETSAGKSLELIQLKTELASLKTQQTFFEMQSGDTIAKAYKAIADVKKSEYEKLVDEIDKLDAGWYADGNGIVTKVNITQGEVYTSEKKNGSDSSFDFSQMLDMIGGGNVDLTSIVSQLTSSSPGNSVGIQIDNYDQFIASFNVGKYDLLNLKVGQSAKVTSLDSEYKGVVDYVSATASENTGLDISSITSSLTGGTTSSSSALAKVKILNPDEKVIIGFDVDISVQIGKVEDVIVLPVEALRFENGQKYIFVYNEHTKTVEKRTVELGSSEDTKYEITEGLSIGEQVVKNPLSALKDGDKIAIKG